MLEVVQRQADHDRVVFGESTLQRRAQLGILVRSRPRASSASSSGSRSPAIKARSIARPDTPRQV